MQKKCKTSNDVGITEMAMAILIMTIGLLYYHTHPPYQFANQTSSTVMSSISK